MDAQIQQSLEQIKTNYGFQTENQLNELLHSLADAKFKGVTYWDYIEVETLLSLSKPKTEYPDENIFIKFHQICELYFSLIIQELKKLTSPDKFENKEVPDKKAGEEWNEAKRWNECLKRISRYWRKLIFSFDVLKDGMYKNEFREFRLALLPASGFQTYQFRLIEIMLTSINNLIKTEDNIKLQNTLTIDDGFSQIYWRHGATYKLEENGKVTVKPAKVLENFNQKYDGLFKEKLLFFENKNVYSRYLNSSDDFKAQVDEGLKELERNILLWKLAHYRAVLPYLLAGEHGTGEVNTRGTGGTDWKNYLPIVKQKIIYFPEFWNEIELTNDVSFQNKINNLIYDFYEDFKHDASNIFPEIKRIIHKEGNSDV